MIPIFYSRNKTVHNSSRFLSFTKKTYPMKKQRQSAILKIGVFFLALLGFSEQSNAQCNCPAGPITYSTPLELDANGMVSISAATLSINDLRVDFIN